MIVAIIFVGLISGLASGGVTLFGFGAGWIAAICGFYGGAMLGVAITALRVATIRDEAANQPTPHPHRGSRIARIG